MKTLYVFLIVLFSLGLSSCTKPTLPQILTAAQDSINEACSVEWLNTADCTDATDAISAVTVFTQNGNDADKIVAVKNGLNDTISRLPPDSKIIPYLNWIVVFLG